MILSRRTAIVGIGATEFSKCSGRSELQLAVEAVAHALDDAGLAASDIDGFATFAYDNNLETDVARVIGAGNLTYCGRASNGGGGACAPIQQAAMAIVAGIANTVVCYRAMNERSQYRFGDPLASVVQSPLAEYHAVQGAITPAAKMAVCMRRYMHDTGASAQDFGHIAVASRKHAATNPMAFFYQKPITLHDYLDSRMIADPLRLFDCCQESDGAVAVIVTRADRARSLRQKPAIISAAAQAAPRGILSFLNFYRDNISPFEEVCVMANELYAQSRLTSSDIQAAIIYDHFVPSVMPALEACGFCEFGEGKDFVKGGNIEIGGSLPINMNGGQVGEAYIHGMNGLAEAVRQLRGTAINQVDGVENILVTAGSNVATSGVILSAG